jgi:hypothetical protein
VGRKEADRGGGKLHGVTIDFIAPRHPTVKSDGSQVCECRLLQSHGLVMTVV